MASPAFQQRKKWSNYVKDQQADPLKYFTPTRLSHLIDIVQEAGLHGLKVKAIGSGHSSSDIATTPDYMIDTHGLNNVLDLSLLTLTADANESKKDLWLVECGITLAELNNKLDDAGKALINMGAYTGQTLAGVISTSTHGSGMTLGAFPAYAKSFIIVSENGELFQIEPSPGKAISEAPIRLQGFGPVKLVQDDLDFNVLAVSMGCIGIIYAVVLEVTDAYKLEETRVFSYWEDVKKQLVSGTLLEDFRHVEVLVSPYRYRGRDHKCLITKRKEEKHKDIKKRGHRKFIYNLLLSVVPDFVINAVMRFLINHVPKFIPSLVQMLISTLTDDNYIDKSFKVLDLGKANNLAAYATEIAFPSSTYIDAVEAIILLVNQSVQAGQQYLTAPFSLRFVKTNNFFLSMQYGKQENDFVCMIEFPTVSGTIGGTELLGRIESSMYAFGGIPHWGQLNHLGGNGEAALQKLYPAFSEWMTIYKKYVKRGMFQNDFTRRCLIDIGYGIL